MEIEEIKNQAAVLRVQIYDLVATFEEETGCKIELSTYRAENMQGNGRLIINTEVSIR